MRTREVPRFLRTVRHLRPGQALALLRHRLRPAVRPAAPPAVAPELVITEPKAAFPPPPDHAWFDGVGRIRLVGFEVLFPSGVDFGYSERGPLFAFHLHQFDYLRREGIAPARRAELMDRWIAEHRTGIGWSPHPLGLRILAWLKLLLTPGALELGPERRRRLLRSLAAQAETLDRHLEFHLGANHLLSNLLAVVAAGIAFRSEAADRWLRRIPLLRRELREQVPEDGAHYERSPMYHALLLETVLDVLHLASVSPRAPAALRGELGDAAARMLGALELYTHPDGEIALFADSALGMALAPARLRDYAGALGVEPRGPNPPGVLARAGYVRLEAGGLSLLASVGGPAPAHQPGHAHCDALSFELCLAGERVVVDTGVYEYLPGPLRDLARSTRGHATVEVGGFEQSEMWGAHRVGGRARVGLLGVEPGRALEAVCRGWATRRHPHRRRIELAAGGLEIRDEVGGGPVPVCMRYPLAPGSRVELAGGRAGVRLAGGGRLVVELPPELAWRVESAPCFPAFGRVVERPVLVGEGVAPTGARTRFRPLAPVTVRADRGAAPTRRGVRTRSREEGGRGAPPRRRG